jgi:uncharacterized protein YcgI (DUF1989 family)
LTTLGLVPAKQGKAVFLRKGETIEIINTHGNQVLDTWAYNAHDVTEHMSMEHTRSVNSTIYANAGDLFSSNRRRPMLRFRKDTSPGKHDTLLCACNKELYTELGCKEYHRNCEDNLREALKEFYLTPPSTPSPFNLFMNVVTGVDGEILRSPPASKAGDSVELVAEMDVLMVFSSCPQDIKPVNGPACTPSDMHYRVLPPGTPT